MSRTPLPLVAPDLSRFARALRRSWLAHAAAHAGAPPGHVELLNMLARAAGHANLQALHAHQALRTHQAPPVEPVALEDTAAEAAPLELTPLARKALGQFDAEGRLQRWPVKFSVQQLILWPLWTRFAARRVYTEREVNAVLKEAHTFGDHATLRRELVNHKLLTRTSDCAEYRKLPARPDAQTRALLAAWRARVRAVRRPRVVRDDAPVRRAARTAAAVHA